MPPIAKLNTMLSMSKPVRCARSNRLRGVPVLRDEQRFGEPERRHEQARLPHHVPVFREDDVQHRPRAKKSHRPDQPDIMVIMHEWIKLPILALAHRRSALRAEEVVRVQPAAAPRTEAFTP